MSLICPKCGRPLTRTATSYVCDQGHGYDIARQGYVNLLLANQRHSAQPGDEKDALQARRAFLDRGFYAPVAQAVAARASSLLKPGQAVLDAGCGTGYYTAVMMAALPPQVDVYATDISKVATAMTARACPRACCFVSSVFHLPLSDASLDGVVSIFCPYGAAEFIRVLKPEGWFAVVGPGPRHLWEMKQAVYEQPYANPQPDKAPDGFVLQDRTMVEERMHLPDTQAIKALWTMTPYYHTTSPDATARLLGAASMDVTLQVALSVYRKETS